MNACECKPGRYDDGWQEVRCEACLRVEREVWTDLLHRLWRDRLLGPRAH